MIATERWIELFIAELECVRCRSKENCKMYDFYGHLVNPEVTIEELSRSVGKYDVWCDNCTPQVNMRVKSSGRFQHKREASQMANLRLHCVSDTAFDKYVLRNKTLMTKQDLEMLYKSKYPCQVCGQHKHYLLMVFHKDSNRQVLIQRGYTLKDYVDAISQTVLLCVECHIMASNGLAITPTQTIILTDDVIKNLTKKLS